MKKLLLTIIVASCSFAIEPMQIDKGQQDPRVGPPVVRGSGAGTSGDYFWIDSDEPDGPSFEWIDLRTAWHLRSPYV